MMNAIDFGQVLSRMLLSRVSEQGEIIAAEDRLIYKKIHSLDTYHYPMHLHTSQPCHDNISELHNVSIQI